LFRLEEQMQAVILEYCLCVRPPSQLKKYALTFSLF